jgi:hypothetical protein
MPSRSILVPSNLSARTPNMAHPYISGPGNVLQMLTHLRRNFPPTVTSETVKKLGLAPNNESYVINALQFLNIIDESGKKTDIGAEVFSIHNDEDFKSAFGGLVLEGYKDLFELRGDEAWKMDRDSLVNYFRMTDKTSAVIGTRQAAVFEIFARFAGHGDIEVKAKPSTRAKPASIKKKAPSAAAAKTGPTVNAPAKDGDNGGKSKRDMALTVRIEINLPAEGTQETYDSIFQSIRANLFDE